MRASMALMLLLAGLTTGCPTKQAGGGDANARQLGNGIASPANAVPASQRPMGVTTEAPKPIPVAGMSSDPISAPVGVDVKFTLKDSGLEQLIVKPGSTVTVVVNFCNQRAAAINYFQYKVQGTGTIQPLDSRLRTDYQGTTTALPFNNCPTQPWSIELPLKIAEVADQATLAKEPFTLMVEIQGFEYPFPIPFQIEPRQ